ncbi:PP2C family protein-serine/threonine phosphatase [Planctomonas psychrotolerans]|uniref:PP2C family protein-serine/threonine phosphatase n=1 Tax=Planctomonas psychrotolerans TaxID=2528712 RepID=UPI001239B248|nr:protein phosphatase 2C domain-containing protein [Planctomonas psychrotolerans]
MTVDASRVIALPTGTLTVNACAASDRGLVRKVNEDSFLAKAPIYLVADGMGGHSFGDLASQTLVATFDALFAEDSVARVDDIVSAIGAANTNIMGLIDETQPAGSVAGTTLTGVALVERDSAGTLDGGEPGTGSGVGETAWMAFNVGDSRVYGWNGATLAQLTVDHSAVQEMVNRGLITEAQAAVHPERNIITRAVGSHPRVQTDVWLLPVRGHQFFLACSDGLTKELNDDDIAAVLTEHGTSTDPVSDIAQALVDAAVTAGGRDNITVVVVESHFAPMAGGASGVGAGDAHSGASDVDARRRRGVSLEDTAPRS